MRNAKRLLLVVTLLAAAASASACADATGPRSENKPCETQGSNTCP